MTTENDSITILIVDDGAVDRFLAGGLVEQSLGWKVHYADNGLAALTLVEHDQPRMVLTDLQMPAMDGLELVEALRAKFPLIPVVLMTGKGSEKIAIQALQQGAASYVTKKNLTHDLIPTLENVLAASQVERRHRRVLDHLEYAEERFALVNDPELLPPLIAHLQSPLLRMGLCDQPSKTRVGIALGEALVNALYHGNLELSSDLRQGDESQFYQLAAIRLRTLPYRDRKLRVSMQQSFTEARYVIADEGPGFNPSLLEDPTNPTNLEKGSGRGLLLIRTFMDEVEFNDKGNQVTLVKHRDRGKEERQ